MGTEPVEPTAPGRGDPDPRKLRSIIRRWGDHPTRSPIIKLLSMGAGMVVREVAGSAWERYVSSDNYRDRAARITELREQAETASTATEAARIGGEVAWQRFRQAPEAAQGTAAAVVGFYTVVWLVVSAAMLLSVPWLAPVLMLAGAWGQSCLRSRRLIAVRECAADLRHTLAPRGWWRAPLIISSQIMAAGFWCTMSLAIWLYEEVTRPMAGGYSTCYLTAAALSTGHVSIVLVAAARRRRRTRLRGELVVRPGQDIQHQGGNR
ncbi:hypothetical protein [Georgenia yuyongxinii]|uniref:Uncharacterized protein n=1 Tax=Georgenia yuyongxinii TaxID=2589797 RepID=A0A552WU91_9MICO|nr:hypothetical protein [Georgenia yuyongxinii]TRW46411.1 hypothetical protein FJ693_05650 [Georgenia yuyongxinii]